jgi:hypothetical protein
VGAAISFLLESRAGISPDNGGSVWGRSKSGVVVWGHLASGVQKRLATPRGVAYKLPRHLTLAQSSG